MAIFNNIKFIILWKFYQRRKFFCQMLHKAYKILSGCLYYNKVTKFCPIWSHCGSIALIRYSKICLWYRLQVRPTSSTSHLSGLILTPSMITFFNQTGKKLAIKGPIKERNRTWGQSCKDFYINFTLIFEVIWLDAQNFIA